MLAMSRGMLVQRTGLKVFRCPLGQSRLFSGRELWEEHWQHIEQMRSSVSAAVDSMGAEALAHSGTSTTGKSFRFQTLIATMLSPQTKDAQTAQAFNNLMKMVHPNPFLPSALSQFSSEEIEKQIRMTSFYSAKAKNILAAAQQCKNLYDDDIPSKIVELLQFKGVGPKIGYLTFSIAWGETLGICVDTHVHRIANRLDWVDTWRAKSNGPEKTRKELEAFLPHDRWEKINVLLVGFGQTICKAISPKCDQCTIKSNCRYFEDKSHMR